MSDEPIDLGKPFDFRWMDKHNRLGTHYEHESDRAAALLAASFLEEQTREALLSILVEDDQLVKPLFKGYGPLSSFSACIDMLYALGHIPKEIQKEFHLIRKIRNHFAHHPDVTDFNSENVKNWCHELITSTWLLKDKKAELEPRIRFLRAVSHCVGEIRMGLQFVPRPKTPPLRSAP